MLILHDIKKSIKVKAVIKSNTCCTQKHKRWEKKQKINYCQARSTV